MQVRPRALNLVQLAETVHAEVAERGLIVRPGRVHAELPVELRPREAERARESERAIGEPQVEIEAERRPRSPTCAATGEPGTRALSGRSTCSAGSSPACSPSSYSFLSAIRRGDAPDSLRSRPGQRLRRPPLRCGPAGDTAFRFDSGAVVAGPGPARRLPESKLCQSVTLAQWPVYPIARTSHRHTRITATPIPMSSRIRRGSLFAHDFPSRVGRTRAVQLATSLHRLTPVEA